MPRCLYLLVLLLTAGLAAPLHTLPATPAAAAGRSDTDYTVVGGEPATEDGWPSVVALVRAEEPDDVAGQLCAGTAVAADLVLTAAHCIHSVTGDVTRGPDQLRVVAGRTDLSVEGGVELPGTEIYVHPFYDARRKRYDVAVVRVAGGLGVPVQPLVELGAPVPEEGDRPVVVGWGRTGAGDANASRATPALQQAELVVPSQAACTAAYDGTLDLDIHMCAGGGGTEDEPSPDACNGDSGGPLLLRNPDDGVARQIGITSFGPTPCGVGEPGVYVQLAAMRDFVDDVVAGALPPTILPGIETTVGDGATVRVADTTTDVTHPITQAVAASRAVFDPGRAELAVIARHDAYADVLAGSSLGFGRGPVLLTSSEGPLAPQTRDELLRAVRPGATVYLLGGTAAIPEAVADELVAEGFLPQRLAGDTREATAVAIGHEVVRRHGGGSLPFGTAVLVTADAWPDAVLAGQLGVWWGFPILLTPTDGLHSATEAALRELTPARLLVVGGPGVVAESVLRQARRALPGLALQRLAGQSRTETGIAVARWHAAELAAVGERPPDAVLAVNLRREDGYAHVLAATPLLGATAGVLLPVEGDGGDVLTGQVVEAFCGVGGQPLAIGGADVISEAVASRLSGIVNGTDC